MAVSISELTSEARNTTIQFTGIVVVFNEARRLRACLSSLQFCDELLVIDLGSEDGSGDIARECGAHVIQKGWAPVVEQILPDVVPRASHDWIVRADPDEVFARGLAERLVQRISQRTALALVRLPYQYYFCGKALSTTIWGGTRYIPRVFHRDRVSLQPSVHRGIGVKEGYEVEDLNDAASAPIEHYWVDTLSQLAEKHWRYIQNEGEARYNSGERFGVRSLLRQSLGALKLNLFEYGGLRGGVTGTFLSVFYAWYVAMSWLSLWRYQSHQGSVR